MRIINAIACILLTGIGLHAADFYVSPVGSDLNAGTFSAPFKTIAKCESVLTSGSTCYIRGGSYSLPFAPPVIIGEKTISQYANESISLALSDGSVIDFAGSATTWDTAGISLTQMLTIGRSTTPPPVGLLWAELWISGSMKATIFGTSLPLILNYTLNLSRNTTASSKAIQVRVHQ